MLRKPLRHLKGIAQCLSMRSDRVSMPVRIRNEFIGAMEGPRSRKPSTRQAMAKAMLPKRFMQLHAMVAVIRF